MMRVRSLVVAFGLVLCGALGAAPALAATGSISGTVTKAGSGEALEGILVCAYSPNFGVTGGCTGTDSAGNYTIPGLQPNVYKVGFEEEGEQNYLAQWYPGKVAEEEAGGVTVGDGEEVSGINAVLVVGGQMTGRVTDVADGEPIEGIEVCAPQLDRVTEGGVIHCDRSDADGEYLVQALPTGLYKIEFTSTSFPRGGPNYIRQYYPGKPSWSEAEVRSVTAGETLAGIDAAMREGIEVSGTVTEAGGTGLTWESRVCALNATSEEIVQCDFPDMDGTYWMPGLPYGAYKVSFAVDVEEEPGLILRPDGFVRQYYKGKPTFAEADLLSSTGPASFTGIDAQLVRGPETFPNKRPPAPQPIVVTLIERPQAPPLRCKKGFRKRFVKGKRRCLKIHRKHRHRGQGPRAHATGR